MIVIKNFLSKDVLCAEIKKEYGVHASRSIKSAHFFFLIFLTKTFGVGT